jgi:ABC-type transport system involved in cytochrome c biogenesis permease subunit
MSAPALPLADVRVRPLKADAVTSPLEIVHTAMGALASLKLTVALFAFGIFIVYVGTVAQQEADIWQVVRQYFHAWIMWVDVNLLFPKAFFPFMPHLSVPLFPAPGGLTIGSLMAINLLAAHGWRFTIQARGLRLWLGVVVMLVGVAVGVVIIWAGHNSSGFQAKPPFTWDTFWRLFLSGAVLLWCVAAAAYGYFGVRGLVDRLAREAVPWIEFVMVGLLAIPLLATLALIGWGSLVHGRPSGEALRVVWQLIQGGLAGLILLVGCIMVFRKRGGVVLLHTGVGLLMFNELWVAMTARERQVFMQEGQTVNYLRDIRTVELALVDRSADKTDDHIVVPRDMLIENYETNKPLLKAGKTPWFLTSDLLPLKVAVLAYYKNADVKDLPPGEKTLATAGRGLTEALVERPAAKGTDTDGGVDLAGAYVQFADREGKDLGTFLLSQLASEQKFPERFAEKLTVGDKTYDLFLRFKREYKPYTLSLVDVRKDDYLASDTPRNYSSDIKIVDPESGVDEQVHIKMNDPLRYRGDTLYQSGYHKLPDGEATTLQVVLNRGWMIPYVACMVVVIGMVAHFLITVTRFVGRREAQELEAGDVVRAELADAAPPAKGKRKAARGKPPARGEFNWSAIGLPVLAVGIFLLVVGSAIRPPHAKPTEMDFARFGQLPVAHMGRVKPLDSLARNTLRALTINWESAKTGEGSQRISAAQWLLEVMAGTEASTKMPVIRIDSKEVRRIFDLPDRQGFAYAVKELQPKIGDFEKQVEAAHATAEEKRTIDQRRVLELDERLKLYVLLVRAFSPPELPEVPSEEQMKSNPGAVQQYISEFRSAMSAANRAMTAMKAPRLIPLSLGGDEAPEDAWKPYPVAYALASLLQLSGQTPDDATVTFNSIIAAYHKRDAGAFNAAVAKYESILERARPPLWDENRVHQEAYFNHVSPFFVALILYVIAFVTAIFGWLTRYRPLNWAAFTLILLTFLLHTAALATRIYISGRPPVTNLYSASVFVGWGIVLFGLAIEAIYRLGFGNIAAAVAGYATLQIAYQLSSGGDTIAVLQAVLDTQFWLATHVVCITLGYAATYLAGLFGLLFVVFGFFTPLLDRGLRKELGRIIYGITCFAILFSFFGTVLGGLWADDSWGRFWGWDPKENGALIIVLWNALILHARWDKLIADRGLAVLAIGGNIVTSWSFFGVNQLGIGLHSYGFTSGIAVALDLFALSQLVLIGIGCVPTPRWWSYKAEESVGLKPATE